MRQILLFATVMLFIQSLSAQIPADYYDDASGLTGDALKTALHNIIDDHTEGSYALLWEILPESDEDPNNKDNFILLYTGRSIPKATSAYPDYNREHVWAKSHGNFGTTAPAGTDAHHLRPSDVSVNSSRGNKDFDNGGSYHSEATECKWDSDSWEPRDAVKGDVARMMFYMVVRYEGDVSGEPDLELVDYITGSTSSPIFGKLSTLLEWHNNDPVDDIERHRNEVVYSYQKNANPFIDHPEYVAQIWGGASPTQVAQPIFSVAEGEKNNDIQVAITCSTSDATIYYTTNGTTPTVSSNVYSAAIDINSNITLKAFAIKSGLDDSQINSALYTFKVATPEISPLSGDISSTETITITSASVGSIIRYSTDGSTPNAGSTLYTGSFSISESATIKAIALKTNYTNSDLTEETYTYYIFKEDFETITPDAVIDVNDWITFNQAGTKSWEGRDFSFNKYAQMSAYNTSEPSNIAWLITPEIDLSGLSIGSISFKTKDGYNNGEVLEVFISSDYTGTGDPNSVRWTKLNPTIASGTTTGYAPSFTESGNIDISAFCGNTVYIAYKYTGGSTGINTTIQLDDILITGEPGTTINFKPEITNIENAPIEPASSDAVSISATITDSDGTITGVELHWGLSSGSLTNTIGMSISAGDTYITNTNIPAQANGATVYYEIAATDNEPETTTSIVNNYQVIDNTTSEAIIDEKFTSLNNNDVIDLTDWVTINQEGNKNWQGKVYLEDHYIQASAYQSSDATNVMWVLTPEVNFDDYTDEELSFKSAQAYWNHDGLSIWIIQDLVGSDIANATQLELTATLANNSSVEHEWITSGIIDLSAIAGSARIAYKYEGADPVQTTSYRIDDVLLTGIPFVSTNKKPQISTILNSPLAPTESDDVTVSATITDDGTVASAKIKWGTSVGVYPNEIIMTNVSDLYSGIIPAQTGGATVYFVIEAIDDEAEIATSIEKGISFSTIGNVLPEITAVNYTPSNPESSENVTVTSTITDSDGTISSAIIKWGKTSGNYTNEVTMNVAKGDYSGSIPAQANETHVYFVVYTVDNDGGSAQSLEKDYIVYDPNLLPVISNILNTPATPIENEDVAVSATITDSDGILSKVELHWGLSSGSLGNVINMSKTSGNTYTTDTDIPSHAAGTFVYYVIKATDNEPEITTSVERSFSFSEIPNSVPLISNVSYSPIAPMENELVIISATITDSDGTILSAKIKWGTTSGDKSNEVIMTNTGDIFSGTVPSQFGGTSVYFIIEAIDDEPESTISVEQSFSFSQIPNEKPIISNISNSPATPTDAEEVSVSATITDSDGTVTEAKIRWGMVSGSLENIISMTGSGDIFSGVIPAQEGGKTVYYLIEATDNEPETVVSSEKNYSVSTTNGIDYIFQENIKIYPNPTKDKINIELNDNVLINSVQVFNLVGEKVLDYNNVNESQIRINLEQFSKGLYMIQVNSSNSTAVKKIMLK